MGVEVIDDSHRKSSTIFQKLWKRAHERVERI